MRRLLDQGMSSPWKCQRTTPGLRRIDEVAGASNDTRT
jgi:hypothetical protein